MLIISEMYEKTFYKIFNGTLGTKKRKCKEKKHDKIHIKIQE